MRLRHLCIISLAFGCGPDIGPVDFTFTVSNLSSYDFVSSAVCFEDEFTADCAEIGAMDAGATGTASMTVFDVEYGTFLYVDAAAVDTEGFLYVWNDNRQKEYTIAPTLDVTVSLTDEDCCWE